MLMRRLKYWMESGRRNEALREEIELHLAEQAAELQEAGLTPESARAEARRRFGNVGLKHEASREIWMIRFWSELGQDVRYGWRTIAANKTFSLLATLSLALGIGANTAIFSFMDWLLLRSLPVSDPVSLAVLNWRVMQPKLPACPPHSIQVGIVNWYRREVVPVVFPAGAIEKPSDDGGYFIRTALNWHVLNCISLDAGSGNRQVSFDINAAAVAAKNTLRNTEASVQHWLHPLGCITLKPYIWLSTAHSGNFDPVNTHYRKLTSWTVR